MSGTVIVFAPAPELGRVKTRLAATLGDAATLALYRAFLTDTLETASATGARVVLAHTGARPAEAALADEAIPQRGETWGARVDSALADVHDRAGGPLLLVGADTPHLGSGVLRGALRMLAEHEAVLGPSSAGSVFLLGFAGPPVPVAKAFEESHEAAAIARLIRPALLPLAFDIEHADDLIALMLLCETRTAAGAWVPPHTTSALATLHARIEDAGRPGARQRRLILDEA